MFFLFITRKFSGGRNIFQFKIKGKSDKTTDLIIMRLNEPQTTGRSRVINLHLFLSPKNKETQNK